MYNVRSRCRLQAQLDIEKVDEVIVGMNKFTMEQEAPEEVLKVDPALERAQVERLRAWRDRRAPDVLSRHQED